MHTDVRGLVRAVAAGRYLNACRIARASNPFASLCGRICSHPCEDSCVRGILDAPLSLRALERFVCEQFGPESVQAPQVPAAFSEAPGSVSPAPNGHRVAIVGGGPAGLSCAHDLARLGYSCTVFERRDTPGGAPGRFVPGFQLCRDVLRKEITAIASLPGVEIRTGADIPLADGGRALLEQGYAAVFLACGASSFLPPPFQGALSEQRRHPEPAEGDGVPRPGMAAVPDWLETGAPDCRGRSVVVADCCPPEHPPAHYRWRAMADAACTALRAGAAHVLVVSPEPVSASGLRSLAAALESGADLLTGVRVQVAQGVGKDGLLLHLSDGSSRPCSLLLFWSGAQAQDIPPVPGVFVGGAAVRPEEGVAHAVASGQQAARDIHQFISGRQWEPLLTETLTPVSPDCWQPPRGLGRARWEPPHLLPALLAQDSFPLSLSKDDTSECAGVMGLPAELSFAESAARGEAERCLQCEAAPVLREDLCTLCGRCVYACPEGMLSLRPADGEGGTRFSLEISRCVRCGLCARACRTGALSMAVVDWEEDLAGG